MEEEMSIFQLLSQAMGEGTVLPEDFMLPSDDEQEPGFVQGALDGIFEYHTEHTPLDRDSRDRLWGILDTVNEADAEEFDEAISEFCKEHRAISIIDDIQNYLLENSNRIEADAVYETARSLMILSTHVESVKVGMILMELFDIEDDIAWVANVLGRSDEFTLFAIFLLRKLEDGQDMIMSMGEDVSGWGRIHCVDFIEPENESIREWLLYDGVNNTITGAYSALTIYEKARIEDYLADPELDMDKLIAILAITMELLDEGTVRGISAMDDPMGYIKRVLRAAIRLGRLE